MGTESTLETFAQMKFHEDKIRNRLPIISNPASRLALLKRL